MRTATSLALALLVACSGGGEAFDPGRLVVTGSEGEVELVDPESGERRSLAGPSLHQGPVQPTASRDGSVVVWSAITDDGSPVVTVHDGEETRVVDVPTLPFFYAFDASSTTVAALGNDPRGAGVALLFIDLTTDTAGIAEVGQPYYLDWHPEDPTLVVHVGFEDMALVSESGERMSLPVQPGDFQAPAWTDDGRVLAPLRAEGATAAAGEVQATTDGLALVDPEDGSFQPVVVVDGMVMFDIAGDRVAFLEGDAGIGSLDVVGLDGSGRTEVAAGDVVAFEWSPDGELLLLHVVDAEAGLVPSVWDGEKATEFPAYLPTGVFLTQYLPFWSQYARTITQWSPDSSAFAYADASDEAAVWIQPLTGERRSMGPGEMVTWAP